MHNNNIIMPLIQTVGTFNLVTIVPATNSVIMEIASMHE